MVFDGAANGHFFENYVIGELIRNYAYGNTIAKLSYYRDTNQKEIDMVIEEDGVLHPIEIKRSSNPEKKIVKTFQVLNTTGNILGTGLIICMTDKVFPVDVNNIMIPASII